MSNRNLSYTTVAAKTVFEKCEKAEMRIKLYRIADILGRMDDKNEVKTFRDLIFGKKCAVKLNTKENLEKLNIFESTEEILNEIRKLDEKAYDGINNSFYPLEERFNDLFSNQLEIVKNLKELSRFGMVDVVNITAEDFNAIK